MSIRTVYRKTDVNNRAGDDPWLTLIHSSEACRTRGRVRTTGALDVSIHKGALRLVYTVSQSMCPASKHEYPGVKTWSDPCRAADRFAVRWQQLSANLRVVGLRKGLLAINTLAPTEKFLRFEMKSPGRTG